MVRESTVAFRPRRDDGDSALVFSHPANVCSITLRDESGRLHDLEKRGDTSVPLPLTRPVPDRPWHATGSAIPGTLLTVLALPPGRYTLTAYTTTDDWSELEPTAEARLARTDCSGSLVVHPARLPIRIEPARLTLLHLPSGAVDFTTLRAMSFALDDHYDGGVLATWLPSIRATGAAMHRELAARQRQPRNGYDLYPSCDGKVAVVRKHGKPFDWYSRPHDEIARQSFRSQVAIATRSVQATGIGNGCVEPLAFVYLLTDPEELTPLAKALGERMAEEDLAGEIDLVLTGPIDAVPGTETSYSESR